MSDSIEVDIAEELGVDSAISVQQLTLYIPNKDRQGKPVRKHQEWVRRDALLLARMGGGYTVSPAVEGGWLAEDGQLVVERPTIIYSFLKEDFPRYLPDLKHFLHDLGRETNQGEVAFSIDNVFFRISKFARRAS